MRSVVLELLRAFHSENWDSFALKSFVLVDLIPDMVDQLRNCHVALSRRRHRPDELQRVCDSLSIVLGIIGQNPMKRFLYSDFSKGRRVHG
jgi:hypothetical protein